MISVTCKSLRLCNKEMYNDIFNIAIKRLKLIPTIRLLQYSGTFCIIICNLYRFLVRKYIFFNY